MTDLTGELFLETRGDDPGEQRLAPSGCIDIEPDQRAEQ